jgi:hypothetical protein
VTAAAEDVLRRTYRAFNARDVDTVLAVMHPDVDWPNAFEGGRVRGRELVRAYWARQFDQINPEVTPVAFAARDDGRVAVKVHQVVRSLDGEVISEGPVVHVYLFVDGLVQRMDVEEKA